MNRIDKLRQALKGFHTRFERLNAELSAKEGERTAVEKRIAGNEGDAKARRNALKKYGASSSQHGWIMKQVVAIESDLMDDRALLAPLAAEEEKLRRMLATVSSYAEATERKISAELERQRDAFAGLAAFCTGLSLVARQIRKDAQREKRRAEKRAAKEARKAARRAEREAASVPAAEVRPAREPLAPEVERIAAELGIDLSEAGHDDRDAVLALAEEGRAA